VNSVTSIKLKRTWPFISLANKKIPSEQSQGKENREEFVKAAYFTFFGRFPSSKDVAEKSRLNPREVVRRCIHSREFLDKVATGAVAEETWYPDGLRSFRWLPALSDAFGIRNGNLQLPSSADTSREAMLHALSACLIDPNFESRVPLEPGAKEALRHYFYRLDVVRAFANLERNFGKSSGPNGRALLDALAPVVGLMRAETDPRDIHAALRSPALISGLRRSIGHLSQEAGTLLVTLQDSVIEYAKLAGSHDLPQQWVEAYYSRLRDLVDEARRTKLPELSPAQAVIGGSISADGSCASLEVHRGAKVSTVTISPFSLDGVRTERKGVLSAFPYLEGEVGRHFVSFEAPVELSDASLYLLDCGGEDRSLVALTTSDLLQAETVVAERYGQEGHATFLLTSRDGRLPAVQLSDGVKASAPVSVLQRRKAPTGRKASKTSKVGGQSFAVFDRHGDLSLVAETGQVLWTGTISGTEGQSSFAGEVLREVEAFAIEHAIDASDVSELNTDRPLHFVFDLRNARPNPIFDEYLTRLSSQARITLIASGETLPFPTVDSPKMAAALLAPDDVLIFVRGPAVVPAQAVHLHLLAVQGEDAVVGAVSELDVNVVHQGGLALVMQPFKQEVRQDVLIAGRQRGLGCLEADTMQGRVLSAPLGWRASGRTDSPEAIVVYSHDADRPNEAGSGPCTIEIRLPDRESDEDGFGQALRTLEERLSLGLPVIFLRNLPYPQSYVRRAIDAYHRYGDSDLVTVGVTLKDDALHADPVSHPIARRVAPVFLTCLSPNSAMEHVRANQSRILDAPVILGRPMLVAPVLSPAECEEIFPLSCPLVTPVERCALFGDERERWNPLDLSTDTGRALPVPLLGALALTKNCIHEIGRARDALYDSAIVANIVEQDVLQTLADVGYMDLARDFLTELSNQDGPFFAKLGAEPLIRISKFCLMHGVGADFATSLAHEADVLLDMDPSVILPVTNLFVCMLEEEQIAASFFRLARASAAGKGRDKSALRLIEAAKRYLGHQTFLQLCSIITSNKRNNLSENLDYRRQVAERALNHPLGCERGWGEPARAFHQLLPPRHRLLNSLGVSDLAGFKVAFTDSVRRHGNAHEMLDALRSFTFELCSFGDSGLRQDLYRLCNAKERLILATLLSDRKEISDHLADAPAHLGDGAVVCSSALGDNVSVERFLSKSLEKYQLRPWNLAGDDLLGLFDHALAKVAAGAACPSRGKVSIIMSAFNSDSALMSRAIRSVLLQTYGDFELFVIDDASDPAASREIQTVCQGDPRVKVIRLPVNQGPYIGRNVALQMASGDYIAIHDSDDLAHPQRLEFQVARLNGDDLMMVTSYHARFDVRGCMQFEAHFKPIGDGTMTSMFRRELFDKVGPFLPVRSRGDVEFRERVNKMLGPSAYRHLEPPLMLCHASPGTLSNKTSSNNRHALQLFRTIFSEFRYEPSYTALDAPPVPIPLAMRA
jgi:Glycosyltransferases involved in cell wall biogenesis